MRQYFSIVQGQFKGEALSGSSVEGGRKRTGQVVCSIDRIVNQRDDYLGYQ